MTLSDAFSALALAGCRIKVEAAGSITLDVPPGRPPVNHAVLQALAAHREMLVAVLAPASPPARDEGKLPAAEPTTTSGRPSPYAAQNLARRIEQVPAALPRPQLDAKAILAQARAKLAASRLGATALGHVPDGRAVESPSAGPAVESGAAADDDLPF